MMTSSQLNPVYSAASRTPVVHCPHVLQASVQSFQAQYLVWCSFFTRVHTLYNNLFTTDKEKVQYFVFSLAFYASIEYVTDSVHCILKKKNVLRIYYYSVIIKKYTVVYRYIFCSYMVISHRFHAEIFL